MNINDNVDVYFGAAGPNSGQIVSFNGATATTQLSGNVLPSTTVTAKLVQYQHVGPGHFVLRLPGV